MRKITDYPVLVGALRHELSNSSMMMHELDQIIRDLPFEQSARLREWKERRLLNLVEDCKPFATKEVE